MAELGALLGGILAELARARMIADQLTRELAEEYEQDPLLASMSVPRITMDEVNLTLRFAVDDVGEVPKAEPDPTALRERWQPTLPEKLRAHLGSTVPLDTAEEKALNDLLDNIGRRNLPAGAAREAIGGNVSKAASTAIQPITDGWNRLPPSLRRKLGNKSAFTKTLRSLVDDDLNRFLKRERTKAAIEAALASRVQVAVKRDELPSDPAQQQEIQLTLRGDDLDILLEQPRQEPQR